MGNSRQDRSNSTKPEWRRVGRNHSIHNPDNNPPGVCERSTEEKPAIAKSIVVEPAIVKSIPMEPATVESATVKSTKSAAVEATAATVETSGVGGIWLAERGSAQRSSCDCQSPYYPGPGSVFA